MVRFGGESLDPLRPAPLMLALLLFASSLPVSGAVEVDRDGGYHIVVAIEETTEVAPAQADEYIKSVKEMLDNFGTLLWTATDSEFSLKSAQISVPTSWSDKLFIESNVSITGTFDRADVQVSENTEEPVTENYYPCGKPGVRIRLPFWFLDTNRTGAEFGSQAKGLLNLWLRYRFGVWEEHGYPGHSVTPYFYRTDNVEQTATWRLTSCNGSELFGELGPMNSNSSATCDLHDSYPLDNSCRFHPYPDQGSNHVATSLMNFQWVESIGGLCDEDTHDIRAPNRQNLYCDFRSVWEVIRTSADFLRKEGAIGTKPATRYEVVVSDSGPLLYILLDLSDPDIIYRHNVSYMWLEEVEGFINALPSDVYVKLASYPNVKDSSTDLQQHLDWALLDDAKRNEILSVFNFTVGTTLEYLFDFRLPLAEVLSELKQKKKSSAQTLFLVFRTSTLHFEEFEDYLISGLSEEDFIVELAAHGIPLFAVEANLWRCLPYCSNMSLEYLATESGGMYAEIADKNPESEEDMAGMHSVLAGVLDRLSNKLRQITEYEVIYKEMIANFSEKSVWIPAPSACDTQAVHIYVTVAGARLESIGLLLGESDHDNRSSHVSFSSRQEWFPWLPEMEDPSFKLSRTYSTAVNMSELKTAVIWELGLLVGDTGLRWKGTVTVYGVKAIDFYGTDMAACTRRQALKAEIFTSSDEGGRFGCVSRAVNEEPLVIYAKLMTADGSRPMPIFLDGPYTSNGQLPSIMSAHLLHLRTGTAVTAALRDDGVGADLVAGDGLYSGYVYPHLREGWMLWITVYDITNKTSDEQPPSINPIGRIHSAGQSNLEVTVEGVPLRSPYSAVFQAPEIIRVTTECVDKRFISRVVDTEVAVLDGERAEFVRVTFTAPVVTASENGDLEYETEINGYFVAMAYLAEDVDILINDLTHESVQVQGFLIPTSSSGKAIEEVHLSRGNATAYAMVLIEPGQLPTKSPASNIALIRGWRPEDAPGEAVGCLIGCTLLIEVAGGLVILLLVLTLFLLWRKNRSQASKLRMLSRNEVREFLHGVKPGEANLSAPEYLDLSERIQCLPYDSKYEIPSNKLHIDKTELLGSGTFGNVYKGYVMNHGVAGMAGKVLVVAVKTMKPDMDKSYFKVLLAEVKLMTHIPSQHPNIIRLVGACTKNIRKCQVFLATEFCTNGNLSSNLLKLNGDTVSTWTLIKWAREIANGLEFLGRNKIVHGDLAARNILLDESLVARVSDFGLSKQSREYAKYEEEAGKEEETTGGGLLPWKWVAPEVLTFGKFSVSSDVWSYGVTLWEIFSLGQSPYPGIQWSPDFVHKLEHEGLRLRKPNLASDAVYAIMNSCWTLEPKERPGFSKLKASLDQMLIGTGTADAVGEYLDLQVAAAKTE